VHDHCMSVLAQEAREKTYRIYTTDALMYITQNTAKSRGGSYLGKRFIDFVDEKRKPSKEPETEEEVVTRIRSKLRQK